MGCEPLFDPDVTVAEGLMIGGAVDAPGSRSASDRGMVAIPVDMGRDLEDWYRFETIVGAAKRGREEERPSVEHVGASIRARRVRGTRTDSCCEDHAPGRIAILGRVRQGSGAEGYPTDLIQASGGARR